MNLLQGINLTSGSYPLKITSLHGFTNFRRMLAGQIGIDLNEYEYYGGTKDLKSINHNIQPFLSKSVQYHRNMTVEECKMVARGLNDILDNYNAPKPNYRDSISLLRDGCLIACMMNKEIEFILNVEKPAILENLN